MNAAKAAFLASRPFAWINTAFPFVAAWLVSGVAIDWRFWLGTFFFLFPYNLSMYGINDIFDYESDLLNPRKASIEGALINPSRFRALWIWIIFWTVPLALILLASGSRIAALWLLFSLGMVVAYSAKYLRFKEIPFLDSFTSACHFVTPFIYGFLLAGSVPKAIWVAAGAYFLWAMASHAFGAVQDILFDREAKIASVATVFGARFTIAISSLCYVISAVWIAIYYHSLIGYGAALGIFAYAVNVGRFIRVSDEKSPETNAGWRLFLGLNAGLGAFLTNAYLFSLGIEPIWISFVAAACTYILFFSLLRKR